MEKTKRRVIDSAPKPSWQMSGRAGQGARGPPTAPSPVARPQGLICLEDSQLGSVLGKRGAALLLFNN